MSYGNLLNTSFLKTIIDKGFSIIINELFPVGCYVFGGDNGQLPFQEADGHEDREWERVEGILCSFPEYDNGKLEGYNIKINYSEEEETDNTEYMQLTNVPLYKRIK